jgi:hypothetical protein
LVAPAGPEPTEALSQSGSGSANAQQRYRMRKNSRNDRKKGPAPPPTSGSFRAANPCHQRRMVMRNTNTDQARGSPSHFTV